VLPLLFLMASATQSCGVLGSGGCEDQPSHCEGSEIVRCVPPCSDIGCSRTFERESCGRACVESNGFPFCALSATPDPSCKTAQFYCDGATIVRCEDGYAVRRETCMPPTACVLVDPTTALCAVGGAPDARCPESSDLTSHCDGKTAIKCQAGFATSVTDCADGCGMLYAGAACTLSSTPDPRCDIAVTHAADFYYCDGATLVSCESGFQITRRNCGCAERNGFPECEADAG